jgi:hypothetical protein
MRSLRHPATIIASLALVASLVGTGYASGLINGRQIKNGTITGTKLANHTITSTKLANHTIAFSNLSQLVLDGLNYYTLASQSGTVGGGTTSVVEAHCPSYAIPVSGGYSMPGADNTVTVQVDNLDVPGNGWMAQVKNTGVNSIGVTVQAICVY